MLEYKKLLQTVIVVLMVALLTGGCSGDSSGKEKQLEGSTEIYYLNSDGTKLASYPYVPKETRPEEKIRELFDAMENAPIEEGLRQAKPETVRLLDVNLNGNGQASINVSEEYSELENVDEILCRAAIVKTLSQLKEVSYVEIQVAGVPLMIDAEKAIGYEQSADFIDNIGGEPTFYQDVDMTLYFSDRTGKKLVPVRISVKYDGTVPLEKLVVERLIQGAAAIEGVDTEQVFDTIPPKTELLKISVKEEICYVDFSSGFLNRNPEISNEVTVYSIVNSLAELPNITKVSFTIDGAAVSDYRELKGFDKPFDRNLALIGQ